MWRKLQTSLVRNVSNTYEGKRHKNVTKTSCDISVISRGMQPKQQTTKCLSTMCRSTYNHLTVLCKRMLGHRIRQRIWSYQNLDWQLFDFLIYIHSNTQVFYFTNGHFWPMLKPFPPNAHSLSLSLNPLLCLSLSFLSALIPIPFYLLRFHTNTPLIWWEVIIAITDWT